MISVGLTGGIGSGKSSIAELWNKIYKVPIIDTDVIAHDLVAVGQPLLDKISQHFSNYSILNKDGSLNRAVLREKVFSNSELRLELEKILHPAIKNEILKQLTDLSDSHKLVVVVIPLLLEVGWQELVDKIVVVDLPEELQLQRTMQRDNLSNSQIEAVMKVQVSKEERLNAADYVINNAAGKDDLVQQIKQIHKQIVS